ncbi:hypothetical protein [Duganella sp. Leaf126]|uniref:hypothetical protein n=1 Tax=Duganella sp. Leaf126 TaxID=1736266 RepID=UPI000ADF0F42|nr:hypothetical protein [Duganella sp. Leaf126]
MIDPLLDHTVRHQVNMAQYGNYVLAKMIRVLNLTDADLIGALNAALEEVDADSFKVQRLDKLLASVREVNAQAYAKLYGAMADELQAYVEYEGQFQYDLYKQVVPATFSISSVVPEQVYAAAMAQPMQGRLLKDWAANLSASRLQRVKDTIAVGYTQGKTTSDIVREIRGTKALNYADGLLDTSRREVDAVVRTALSHTAQVTRTRFTKENDDILGDEMWVSTLDGRTSPECRARDHLLYTRGDHQPVGHDLPWRAGPGRIHWCCRSSSIALLKGQKSLTGARASAGGSVDANLAYSDWFKQQTADVQDQVIGPARGDLYRAGKFDVKDFTNDKGRMASLKELRARDGAAFRQPPGDFTVYDSTYPRTLPDTSTPARQQAVAIEERIRDDTLETGAFVAPDGKVLAQRQGQPDRVTFKGSDFDGVAGAVFTHNHPGGTSFSLADVAHAADLNLAELRAVTPLQRFSMMPGKAWPDPGTIQKAYNAELKHAQLDVHNRVTGGELQAKFKAAETAHILWERVAKRLGMQYTRENS